MTVAVLFLASFHIALAVLAGPLNLYGVVQVNGANVAPNTLLDLTATSAPPCYFADVHPNVDHTNPAACDGDADVADLQRVASCWLQNVGPACPQTLAFDLSGTIDVLDLIVVAGEWGWPDFATAGFGRGP